MLQKIKISFRVNQIVTQNNNLNSPEKTQCELSNRLVLEN